MINLSFILIISPEPWHSNFVSKHHYAITLGSMGNRVYFLDPPDNSVSEIQVKNTAYDNVWSISAPVTVKGLRFYPQKLKIFIESNWLNKLEKCIGASFSIIWLFENSRFFDMRFAGSRLKIYHQVDLNQNFHISEAASSADICFCTTNIIKERLLQFNPRVHKINHGLAEVKNRQLLTDDQLLRFDRNCPHAVYIGNMDILYLDVELLIGVAKKFCDVQFHFVGSYKEDGLLKRLSNDLSNIIWWSEVDSNLIPVILNKADVLLVTYRAAEYEEQLASPHKIMEYLASGRTIVATYTEEYKDKRHLLEMVDDSNDFLECFGKVINNLSFYNSAEKQRERILFSQDNTYYRQLDRIFSHLHKHGLCP